MIDPVGEETLKIMRKVSWYNAWLFGLIEKYVKGNILEVGSGIGNFTELLNRKGNVYATDYNRSYLKKLKKSLKFNAEIGYADIEKGRVDFKGIYFDTIVCMNVLEHIKDDEKALKNMHSLLSKNGKLILLVPAFPWAYGVLDEKLGHYRRYSKHDLEVKIKGSGFSGYSVKFANSIGIFGWFFNARILKRKLIPKSQLGVFNIIARPVMLFEKIIKPPFGLSLLVIANK